MGEYGRVWEYTAAYAQHSRSWRHQPPTHNIAPVGGTSRLRTTQPQLAAIHPKTPKTSQIFPILPTKAAIYPIARVCGELRHTIYRCMANACLPHYRIGKIWEGLGSIGKRAKPAAAGRRSAPARNTLGNARCLHTISQQLAAIFSYLPISSHTLSYTLLPSHKIAAINRLAGLAPQSGGSQPPAAASFHHWAFSSLFRILVMVPVVEKPFTNGIKSISVLFSSNACRSPGSRVSTV